jgi:hypothetical protein
MWLSVCRSLPLMQFKTNYWDIAQAYEPAEIRRKTLKQFD